MARTLRVMKRVYRSLLTHGIVTLTLAITALAYAEPTCDTLIGSLETVFEEATSYEIGVGIEQGDNELAYQRQRAERQPDGTWVTETIERRGLPRPGGTGNDGPDGGFAELGLTCDAEHELSVFPNGTARLDIGPADPDGAVTGWSLEFRETAGRWVPREMIGNFEARILFVPVTGRFVTTFSAWQF